MTHKQRAKHLKSVEQISVSDIKEREEQQSSNATSSNASNASLSADITVLSTSINLPVHALEAISEKAKELMVTDGAMLAPGQDADARMVLSRTGKRPHLVVPKKKGGYACNSGCPQYVLSGICSHVVAAAENCGKLASVISSLQKKSMLLILPS